MSVLAGPFAIACVLLAGAGVLKAWKPGDTANALRAVGAPLSHTASRVLVRAFGAVEAGVAVVALLTGNPVAAAVVAISYLAFAAFVVVALRRGSAIASCGCFGKVDTPPSIVHVVLDLCFAGVAIAVVFTGDVALPDVLRDQPLAGVPFALLLAVGVYLVFLAFTALPKTMAAVRGVIA
jgi:choline-glycine betaine transporter